MSEVKDIIDSELELNKFYTKENPYEDQDCEWNETTYNYDCTPVTRIDYWAEPEFTFADNSSIDPEIYFDKGFEAVKIEYLFI